MLVLAHTDGFGVNFHQFGQGVEQSAANRNGTSHGHVLVRELVASNLAGAIDRRSVLAHHINVHLAAVANLFQETLRLATGCTVAQGNGVNLIGLGERLDFLGGARDIVVRCGGINHIVVQEVALLVQAHDLAAGAEAWVDSQHTLAAQRWSKQQLAHILGKSLNRLIIGFFLGRGRKLRLDRGFD